MTTLLTLALMAGSIADFDAAGSLLSGDTTNMGNGRLSSWAVVDKANKPVQIGITLTAKALENLPLAGYNETVKTFDVKVPSALRGMPFEFVSVDYATMGHDPLPVYGVSHFDIHFYMCPKKDLSKMVINGPADKKVFDKPVPPGYMPADYILAPDTEIPFMGAHWVDVNTPELHGHPFSTTIIYGSYNGKVHFIEPMITQAFLENHPDFTAPMKAPKFVTKSGYYPTEYNIVFLPKENEYRIWLGKFVFIKAS